MMPDFLRKNNGKQWKITRLFSEIGSSSQKEELELIIEIESKKKGDICRQLRRIGKCTLYEFVPYLSLKCSAEDAKKIANHVYKKITDARFERNFQYALQNIISIELSNKVSIPPMKPGINYYFRKRAEDERFWNLENIGAYEALKSSSGSGIKIGIIDTGVDYTHTELRNSFSADKGYDFVEKSSKPLDKNGHGTHVAGIAAGRNCGIARNSTLYSLRVLDEDGGGSEADVMLAIEWALKNNLHIVNMSLGSPEASDAFKEMCYYAASRNLMIVAAAGNDGTFIYSYPASFEPVISVAAVDRNNEHAYFSNMNDLLDISAPGVDIVSSYLDNSYRMLSGTSMASPHVTGTLALALSINKDAERVEEFMKKYAQYLDSPDNHDNSCIFGAGLIRADSMVNKLRGSSRILEKIKSYEKKEANIKESGIKKVFEVIKKYW